MRVVWIVVRIVKVSRHLKAGAFGQCDGLFEIVGRLPIVAVIPGPHQDFSGAVRAVGGSFERFSQRVEQRTDGDRFGRYGFELDKRAPSSPRGTRLLARIPNLMGPRRSAEMTYYETPGGAKVFAAGTLNFAASADDPVVSRLLENVWARLSRP